MSTDQDTSIERWMKVTLYVSFIFNTLGAITFAPPFPALFALTSLPAAHPLYMWMISLWIFAFGIGYLWMALTNRPDKIFIAVGAFGKFSFFALIAFFSLSGTLPMAAISSGLGDLALSLIFAYWLLKK